MERRKARDGREEIGVGDKRSGGGGGLDRERQRETARSREKEEQTLREIEGEAQNRGKKLERDRGENKWKEKRGSYMVRYSGKRQKERS